MKKRKIAFVIKNLKMGGPRVSLISLLDEISADPDNIVDLIVMNQTGPLLEQIPKNVRLLPENRLLKIAIADKEDLKSKLTILVRGSLFFLKKIFGYTAVYGTIYKLFGKKLRNTNYDLVIGYQEGESNDVASLIPAKRHAIWYHSNFRTYYKYENNIRISNLYDMVDRILFVTQESCNAFIEQNVDYSWKCEVIKNVIPVIKIRRMSQEKSENFFKKEGLKIVSVGRLSPEKGYDRAINISSRLVKEGFAFEWVIIGKGALFDEYSKEVNEQIPTGELRFIGERKNPYQIVKQADVLVLPSYSEAQPLVVLEGLVLGKPFIATNFDSAKETLDEKCGFIVENSEEGIYGILKKVLKENFRLDEKKRNAQKYEYSNKEILDAIYSLSSL